MLKSSKLRYLMVGGLCAGAHNLIMIGGAAASMHYAVSTVASYVVVMLLGFALHTRFTFAVEPGRRALLRYAGATAINYPLWLVLMFILCDLLRLPMVLASPVGTVLFLVWNYAISHWAIVRPGQISSAK